MPTYPFQCTACGCKFEIVQPMSADRMHIRCACGDPAKQIFSGCRPLVMMHMQPGGNSGFSKADQGYEKLVEDIKRESWKRYHHKTLHPVAESDDFYEGLCAAGYDQHKPQLYGSPGVEKVIARENKSAETAVPGTVAAST